MQKRILCALSLLVPLACGTDRGDMESFGTGVDDSTGDDGGDDGNDDGQLFDVGEGMETAGDGNPEASCKVEDDSDDGFTGCEEKAPPDSFDPEIQWSWKAPYDAQFSYVIPLVANLTDDDDNGEIDLCDVPDIIMVGYSYLFGPGKIYVLDGATGDVHYEIDQPVNSATTPALGDIDDDGLPEYVTMDEYGVMLAFEHDGTLKWKGPTFSNGAFSALAMADLDNDGDVEIIAGSKVVDHEGNELWSHPEGNAGTSWLGSATTAADLDGDGALEVIMGPSAWFADGSLYWLDENIPQGYPQVADLDDDPDPEILMTTQSGFGVVEHDGQIKYVNQAPTGDDPAFNNWIRPAAIHDFDGDGISEFAQSSGGHYSVFEPDGSILWTNDVADISGIASGTAFDFLGDGVADALYGDEDASLIFDGKSGDVVLDTPRTSRTVIEYPIVADIDNDGSAEILVTSSDSIHEGQQPADFTIKAVKDAEDRWIQARRIWNQHTYHVTNVKEDGTIPQFEKPHWQHLNTFRTNAQIENGGICKPMPEG